MWNRSNQIIWPTREPQMFDIHYFLKGEKNRLSYIFGNINHRKLIILGRNL